MGRKPHGFLPIFLLYLFIIYKLNIDIAVIAGHSQRFSPPSFLSGRLLSPFFISDWIEKSS